MRPMRAHWITVVAPLTTSAENKTHDRYASSPPTAPTRIAGASTMPATVIMAYCNPSPMESKGGGCSSGS